MNPFIALVAAVAVNTASVAAEGRWRWLSRPFGRRAWIAHAALILPGWAWFAASVMAAPGGRRVTGARVAGGAAIEAAALALVALGLREIGLAAVVNGDLFGLSRRRPALGSVHRLLRDPIYLGYALLLAGRALRTGQDRLVRLALLAGLLLWIEARVEDWAHRAATGAGSAIRVGRPPEAGGSRW